MDDTQHSPPSALDTLVLWDKYENVAMHFNDLLMRLRSQSLAGIAAISTLVGIFTREGITDIHMDWLVATAIFVAMAFFWIAIFCLDFLYYNRLLLGAVTAIIELERKTGASAIKNINLSTRIEEEFSRPLLDQRPSRFIGVLLFYGIVFAVIIIGAGFSYHMYNPNFHLLAAIGLS